LLLPIHTEVVANISGRGELLALFFSLLLFWELANNKKINFWRSGLWMLLAMGSKETAIAALPIALIIIYGKEKKLDLELLKKYGRSISATVVAVCFYFFLRFFVLGPGNFLGLHTSLIENPLIFTDSLSRAVTSLKILWMYISKTFWPINLCSDYSYNQIPIIHSLNWEAVLGLLLIIVSIVLILKYLRKNPIISLGAGIFLFSFLPVSNIIFPIGTIAGERLFFFPSLGIVILLIFILFKLYDAVPMHFSRILLAIFAVVLIFYSAASFKRQSVWLNEENLFLSAGQCAPNSVLSRSNSGAIYLLRGDIEKAKSELEFARSIKPIYSKGLNNLGLVYFNMGDYTKARELYLESLEQEFPYDGAYENLADLYLTTGKIDLARHWLLFIAGGDTVAVDAYIKQYLDQTSKK
jgi:tetratricopeptide (TPR) repeat protein